MYAMSCHPNPYHQVMSKMKSIVVIVLLLVCSSAFGQTFTAVQSGLWNDPNTWDQAGFPGELDNDDVVVIDGSFTVVYNADDGTSNVLTIASLTIGDGASNTSLLVFPFSNNGAINASYTLNVTGNVNIANAGAGIVSGNGGDTFNSFTIPGGGNDRNHTLALMGDLTSSGGILDMSENEGGETGRDVDIDFVGSINQTVSGAFGAIDLAAIDIEFNNSGTAPNNQVIIASTDFSEGTDNSSPTPVTNFIAGTFVHASGNSGDYVNGSNNIPATITMSFDIQDGTFNLSEETGDDGSTISGDITISGDGVFNTTIDVDGGVGDVVDLTITGILTMSGTSILHVGAVTAPTSSFTLPGEGDLDISNVANVSGGTILCQNLDVNSGLSFLTASAGATITTGSTDVVGIGDIVLDNATLTATGNLINNGSSNFSTTNNSVVSVGGILQVNNIFSMTNSTLTVEGATNVNPDLLGVGVLTLTNTNADFEPNTTAGNSNAIEMNAGSTVSFISNDATPNVINIGNTTDGATSSGRIDFDLDGGGGTATLEISGSNITVNIDEEIIRENTNDTHNITISGGAILNVGIDDNGANEDNNTLDGGSSVLTINDNSQANFGEQTIFQNINITGAGTLSAGTNAGEANSTVQESLTALGAANVTFNGGLTLPNNAIFNMDNGGSLDISDGDLFINQGVVFSTTNVTPIDIFTSVATNANVVQIDEGATSVSIAQTSGPQVVLSAGNPTNGGQWDFDLNGNASTTLNVSGDVSFNLGSNFANNNGANEIDINLSGGASFNIGIGFGGSANSNISGVFGVNESDFTVSDATTTVTFAEGVDFYNVVINDGADVTLVTEDADGNDVDINGDATINDAGTIFRVDDGDLDINGGTFSAPNGMSLIIDNDMDIESGGTLNLQGGLFEVLGIEGDDVAGDNVLLINTNGTVILNNVTANIGTQFNDATPDNFEAIQLEENTSLTISSTEGDIITLGVGNDGQLQFDIDVDGETASVSISGNVTVNIDGEIQTNNQGVNNLTVNNGAVVNVSPDPANGTASDVDSNGTLGLFLIDGAGSEVIFGNNVVFTNLQVLNGANLVTHSNLTVNTNSNIGLGNADPDVGNVLIDNSTASFQGGLTLFNGSTFTTNNSTILISTRTGSISTEELVVAGDFILNGGTVDVGPNYTDFLGGGGADRFVQIDNLIGNSVTGGQLFINEGTMTVLGNAALNNITGDDVFNLDFTSGAENNSIFLGDGIGAENSATLLIAPNLAPEFPTPSQEDVLDVDGNNSQVIIQTDGFLQAGGGNRGDVDLANGAELTIFGNANINAALVINPGSMATINSGVVNIGTEQSSGVNAIDIGNDNPSGQTRFVLNGGTVTVGDGSGGIRDDRNAADVTLGNNNNTPAFGDPNNFTSIEINGGTLNLNGNFALDDANFRFLMTGGEFNLNPQGTSNLGAGANVLAFLNGIVELTGGVITILNPHAASGAGEVFHVNAEGDPANDGGGDFISGLPGPGPTPPILSGTLIRFGDGGILGTLDGSIDGFDVDIEPSVIYNSFVIDNPVGDNREVQIINTNNNYSFSGDILDSAGVFDINSNTIDRDALAGVGGTLLLDSGAVLRIGNTDNAANFPGNILSFGTYSIDIGSRVEYDGLGDQQVNIPDAIAEFGDLSILGSGTKTLISTEVVRDTLLLGGGEFNTASSPVTQASGSFVLRTNTDASGIFSSGSTIGGSNDYTIAYSGPSKSTQSPEFSGSGPQSLVMGLDDATQTLTVNQTLTLANNLALLEGIFVDNANTITVNGNIVHSALHSSTGAGEIILGNGTGIHTVAGDGTGVFGNFQINEPDAADTINVTTGLAINGVFNFNGGIFNIDDNQFTFNSGASTSGTFSATNQILLSGLTTASGVAKVFTGTGSFTWPFGTGSIHTPASVNITSTGAGGIITMAPVSMAQPSTTDAADFELDYYWQVVGSGFASPTLTYDFTYDQSDATGRGNEAAYVPASFDGIGFQVIPSVAAVDEINNIITFADINFISGDFTAGEVTEFGPVLSFFSIADGDWTDPNSWSVDGFGGGPSGLIPGSASPVNIGDNFTISTGGVSNLSAASVNLEATGTLVISDATTGHNFGDVIGTGLLQVVSNTATTPEFPGGNFTQFLSSDGGTVDYTGAGAYTLPNSPTGFNRLVISGGGTKTLPDADISTVDSLGIGSSTTVLISDQTNGDLTVGTNLTLQDASILTFPGNTNRSVAVSNGDLSIGQTAAATLNVVNSGSASHSLSIGGSLVNSGTVDMNEGGATVDVTFTGIANATVSGTGTTTEFNRLIVDKGTSSSPLLEVSTPTFTLLFPTDQDLKPLQIDNGTIRLSNPYTITLSTGESTVNGGDFTIPETGGLSLNNAGLALDISPGAVDQDLILGGLLEIIDGTLTIGDDNTGSIVNNLSYTSASSAITIQAGVLNVGAAIVPNPTSAALAYNQSGGVVSVGLLNATENGGLDDDLVGFEGDFVMLSAGCSFTMSGGELRIERVNTSGDGEGIGINIENTSISSNVTGGTVQVITTNTNNNLASMDVGILSTVPFWNLVIGDGTFFTGNVGGVEDETNLTILNDLILNTGGEFRLTRADQTGNNDNFQLFLGGNLTIQNGSINVGAEDGDGGDQNDVNFTGSGTQIISITGGGTITLQDVNFEGTGTVQLSNTADFVDLIVTDDWALNSGTFDPNGRTVSFGVSPVNNNTTSISGNPTPFFDLELTGGETLSLNTSSVTVTNNLILTDGQFDLASNELILTNESTTAIQDASTDGSDGDFIIMDGSLGAAGVTKSYSNNNNDTFIFPIGTGSDFTPATLEVTNTNGATGTINVTSVAISQPNATQSNVLQYFWRVNTTGFGVGPDINHQYQYVQTDVVGDDALYIDAFFNGSAFVQGNIANVDEVNDLINFITSGTLTVTDFTAGEPPFADPEIFFSADVTAGLAGGSDWDDVNTWRTDGHAGVNVPLNPPTSANPVILADGHQVNIQAGTVEAASSVDLDGSTAILQSFVVDVAGLSSLTGTGSLVFSVNAEPILPVLSSAFVNAFGGTVEYGGTGFYDLPPQSVYNNLILSGAGQRELENNITVNGDLSVVTSGLDFDMQGNNSITAFGGTFTLAAGVDLEVDGPTGSATVTNFPTGFGTFTFDPASEVRFLSNTNEFDIPDLGGQAYGNLELNDGGGGTDVRNLVGNTNIRGTLDIQQDITLVANDFNINIGGDWDRDTEGGADDVSGFLPGTGTVTFDGTAPQQIILDDISGGVAAAESETFYNLIVTNGGELQLNAQDGGDAVNLIVNGDLTLESGASINYLEIAEPFADSLILLGDWINNSTLATPITNGVEIFLANTVGDQDIGGSTNTTFQTLKLQKAAGTVVNISTQTSISSALSLENDGNIVLSADLLIPSPATLDAGAGSFSSNRMIVLQGTEGSTVALVRQGVDDDFDSYDFTFPIGVGSNFTPATLDLSAIDDTGNGTIRVRSIDGNATIGTSGVEGNPALAINRYFIVDLTSINSLTSTFAFTYVDGDIQGNEVLYTTRLFDGTAFIDPDVDLIMPDQNTFGSAAPGTTITSSSTEWIAGENGAFFPALFSVQNGLWDDVNTWNTQADGMGITPSTPPTAGNTDLTIQLGDTVTVNATGGQMASSMNLLGVLDLTGSPIDQSLGPFTGSGTLVLDDADPGAVVGGIINFPSFTTLGTTFFTTAGSTIEFSGAGNYELPSVVLTVQNVIFSGGGTKLLPSTPAVSFTANGDITIDATTLNSNNTNVVLGGNLNTPNSGVFEPGLSTFTLGGTTTQDLPALSFFNLAFQQIGQKNINGPLTVNNFTIQSSSGPVNFNGNTVTVNSVWSNSSVSNDTITSGTVTFASGLGVPFTDVDGIIAGNTTFDDVVINKVANSLTFSGLLGVQSDLTFTSGNFITDFDANTIELGGDFDISPGAVFTPSVNSTVIFRAVTPPAGPRQVSGGGSLSFQNLSILTNTDFQYTSEIVGVDGNLFVSGSTLTAPGGDPIDVGGDVTGISSADINIPTSTLSLEGNLTIDNVSSFNVSTVTFDGANTQALTGPTTLNNLSKINGDTLVINNGLTVSGSTSLTGIIRPVEEEEGMPLDSVFVVSGNITLGGSVATNHVDGRLAIVQDGSDLVYEFPIADEGFVRPVTLSSVDATNGQIEGELFNDPTPGTPGAGLDVISGIRYWEVTVTGGSLTSTDNVGVFTYDPVEDDAFNPDSLRIARSSTVDGVYDSLEFVAADATTVTTIIPGFSFFALGSTDAGDNPLPIELVFFDAEALENAVRLFWQTASEEDNEFFVVERSIDGQNFEEIIRIPGAGTIFEPQNYEVFDERPLIGLSFYRLRQIDFDGTTTVSNIRSVRIEGSLSDFDVSVFPNPAISESPTLTVLGLNTDEIVNITIVTAAGVRVADISTISNQQGLVEIADLDNILTGGSGLYIIKVNTENNTRAVKLVYTR